MIRPLVYRIVILSIPFLLNTSHSMALDSGLRSVDLTELKVAVESNRELDRILKEIFDEKFHEGTVKRSEFYMPKGDFEAIITAIRECLYMNSAVIMTYIFKLSPLHIKPMSGKDIKKSRKIFRVLETTLTSLGLITEEGKSAFRGASDADYGLVRLPKKSGELVTGGRLNHYLLQAAYNFDQIVGLVEGHSETWPAITKALAAMSETERQAWQQNLSNFGVKAIFFDVQDKALPLARKLTGSREEGTRHVFITQPESAPILRKILPCTHGNDTQPRILFLDYNNFPVMARCDTDISTFELMHGFVSGGI